MPTYILANSPGTIRTKVGINGNWSTVAGSPKLAYSTLTKPDTSRRPKPTDLFANATPRLVVSSDMSCTYGKTDDAVPPNEQSGRVTVAPLTYWDPNFGLSPIIPDMGSFDGAIRAKIKQQNLNLAQSVAEYRQTANLFANAVRDLAGLVRNVRSGRGGEKLFKALTQPPGKMSKQVANRWLEFQYGVRPLMSDVYNSAEALAKALDEGVVMYAGIKRTEKKSTSLLSSILIGYTETEVALKVRARYTIRSAAVKQLAEVGITNPALLAWEVIPYSFVVDWFVPVGNWLSSLDALVGVSNLVVQRSYRSKRSTHAIGNYKLFREQPTGEWTQVRTERLAPNSSLRMPTLRYEPSLSVTKILNAAALIRQLRS